jgi:hypothetical protein
MGNSLGSGPRRGRGPNKPSASASVSPDTNPTSLVDRLLGGCPRQPETRPPAGGLSRC